MAFLKKMTEKHKLIAYILYTEYGYKMIAIANLMGVAQSTISLAVKEIAYKVSLQDLSHQIKELKLELNELGYEEPQILPKRF